MTRRASRRCRNRCFNSAATVRSRKSGGPCLKCEGQTRLQFGRDCEVAEMGADTVRIVETRRLQFGRDCEVAEMPISQHTTSPQSQLQFGRDCEVAEIVARTG